MEYRRLASLVRASGVIGAVKVSGQIVVALLVFPVIIGAGGVQALGSWTILQLLVGYGGLVTLGMGPVVTRRVAAQFGSAERQAGESSLRPALFVSLVFAGLLFILIWLFTDQVLGLIRYERGSPVPLVVWLVYAAMMLRLASAILGAAIAGYQRTDLVHIAQFLQLLCFAIVFLWIYTAYELLLGLSIALLASCLLELVITLMNFARLGAGALLTRNEEKASGVGGFIKATAPYFLVDASLLGREPILKAGLYISGGGEFVGLYEVASKVPSAIRQAFVQGLGALMPAFVHLEKRGNRQKIVEMGKYSLAYILLGTVGALAIYALNAGYLLTIWLGEIDARMVTLTLILTLWWIVASINVPAWWLGIGISKIWFNAGIAGFHLLYTVLLVLATSILKLQSFDVVLLWIGGGLLMQVLLYYATQKKTRMIVPIYLNRDTFLAAAYLILTVTLCTLAKFAVAGVGATQGGASLAATLVTYGVALIVGMYVFKRRGIGRWARTQA